MMGNTLELVLSKDNGPRFWVVDFFGNLDSYSIKEKRKEMQKIVDTVDKEMLVFSFANLNFINSECIGLLFNYSETLKAGNKKLILVGAKKNVVDVLNAIGIFEAIPFFATMPEFLKSLENA